MKWPNTPNLICYFKFFFETQKENCIGSSFTNNIIATIWKKREWTTIHPVQATQWKKMTSLCSNLELQNWRPSGESTTKLDLGNSNRLVEPAAPIDSPSLIKRLEHKIKKKKIYAHTWPNTNALWKSRVIWKGGTRMGWIDFLGRK